MIRKDLVRAQEIKESRLKDSVTAAFEWELPAELSSYAVKYFERFVPQKGIERYPDRESNSDKFYCQTKAT